MLRFFSQRRRGKDNLQSQLYTYTSNLIFQNIAYSKMKLKAALVLIKNNINIIISLRGDGTYIYTVILYNLQHSCKMQLSYKSKKIGTLDPEIIALKQTNNKLFRFMILVQIRSIPLHYAQGLNFLSFALYSLNVAGQNHAPSVKTLLGLDKNVYVMYI